MPASCDVPCKFQANEFVANGKEVNQNALISINAENSSRNTSHRTRSLLVFNEIIDAVILQKKSIRKPWKKGKASSLFIHLMPFFTWFYLLYIIDCTVYNVEEETAVLTQTTAAIMTTFMLLQEWKKKQQRALT